MSIELNDLNTNSGYGAPIATALVSGQSSPYSLSFAGTGDTVALKFVLPAISAPVGSMGTISTVVVRRIHWVEQEVLVTVCEDKDDYRFGMNAQEKTNEIAGTGNHTTALFWEYDTRLGRRWNIDPIVKSSESPYAAFSNNPIRFMDIKGADTIDVQSKSIDARGNSGKNFDPSNRLSLFTVFVPEYTGDGGKERRYTMTSDQFNAKFSLSSGNAAGYDRAELNSRKPAKVLAVNLTSPHIFKALARINISTLDKLRSQAVKKLSSNWTPLVIDKFSSFNHGKEYDIKAKQLGGKPFTLVEGYGLVESDYVGNLFYGSVMSNFQSIGQSLFDGDILQDRY